MQQGSRILRGSCGKRYRASSLRPFASRRSLVRQRISGGSSCGGMEAWRSLPEEHAACGQVLHVAVLRRRHDLASALLEAGFPVALANARKWAPVDEAIALNDKRMARLRLSLSLPNSLARRSSTC